MGQSGLREIVPNCFECPDRVACLKNAIATSEGLKMREEILERAVPRGFVNRLQRWSRKKELHRQAKQYEKKKRLWK